MTDQARVAGIKYPVALTEAVWGIVSCCPDKSQSPEGRPWDTPLMFKLASRTQTGQEAHFSILYMMGKRTEEVKPSAFCGPGDDEEPVITIMLECDD